MTEVIKSRKNEKIVHMKKLGSSASYRRETGETLCDGVKLLREALSHGVEVIAVLTSTEVSVPDSVKVYQVERELLEYVSPMKTPQDVLYSCKTPDLADKGDIKNAIILENIQDPGNVGTMIRTANAFSVDTVILTGDCADPFSPKTIRASMGASFRQKMVRMDMDEIASLKEKMPIYGAALSDRSVDIGSVNLKNSAVVIGNEGSGLTDEMLELCSGEIIIPMNPDCESLNAGAAAAVVMWEMRRANVGS